MAFSGCCACHHSIISYLRHLDRLLRAHYSLSIFGQAFIVASRWAGLCQCPPTADAAFKVSELAKWPYIFNAAKILARYLLEDIYYGSR